MLSRLAIEGLHGMESLWLLMLTKNMGFRSNSLFFFFILQLWGPNPSLHSNWRGISMLALPKEEIEITNSMMDMSGCSCTADVVPSIPIMVTFLPGNKSPSDVFERRISDIGLEISRVVKLYTRIRFCVRMSCIGKPLIPPKRNPNESMSSSFLNSMVEYSWYMSTYLIEIPCDAVVFVFVSLKFLFSGKLTKLLTWMKLVLFSYNTLEND